MAKLKNRRDNHYTKRPKSGAAYGESEGTANMRAERDAHRKPGQKYAEKEPSGTGRTGEGRDAGRTRKRAETAGFEGNRSRIGKDSAFRTSFDGKRDRKSRPEEPQDTHIIVGRNPVTEALKSGREIDKLLVASREGSMKKILAMAKEAGIPVMMVEKAAIDRVSDGQVHQGVAAYVSPYAYSSLEDVFDRAETAGEDPFLVVLDGLEDPHNLGAILRTAECAGAHGVIIPKRHSCGLTETVAKSSAGAIEYMPVVKVTNIAQTLEGLRERGLWIAACDMGGREYSKADLSGPMAVVIGSEGFGISKLVKEKCDMTVSMPMMGRITSLNASNAAAVILYEIRRQRDL